MPDRIGWNREQEEGPQQPQHAQWAIRLQENVQASPPAPQALSEADGRQGGGQQETEVDQ